ncbi:MAG: methyltransferase domain-containing protein [Candidatus Eisenbacteria bacterium]
MSEEERREFYTTYARYYDRIYASVDYDAQVEFYEQLFRQCGRSRGRRALDLCCGSGRHTRALAVRGWRTAGLDLSPQMVRLTRGKDQRVAVVRADLRALPLRGPFDLVLCSCNSLLESQPLAALWSTIEQVHAILAPGGVFAFDLTDARIGEGSPEGQGVYEDGPLRYEVRWVHHAGEPILHAQVSLRIDERGQTIGFDDDHHLCAVTIPELIGILEEVGFDVLPLEDDTDEPRLWNGESLKAILVATRRGEA